METLLIEIAKQVPALTALCVLVFIFFRHLSESRAEFLSTMRAINEENLEAREQSREVIRENTQAAKETNLALQSLTMAVKSLEKETLNGHRTK